MSNGLSGMTQFISNDEQDRKDRIRAAKKLAFDNYVNSYIETTSKKSCTCSACRAENAIHPVEVVRTSQGVSEIWECEKCGRTVPRMTSNTEFSFMLNEDRQKATA